MACSQRDNPVLRPNGVRESADVLYIVPPLANHIERFFSLQVVAPRAARVVKYPNVITTARGPFNYGTPAIGNPLAVRRCRDTEPTPKLLTVIAFALLSYCRYCYKRYPCQNQR